MIENAWPARARARGLSTALALAAALVVGLVGFPICPAYASGQGVITLLEKAECRGDMVKLGDIALIEGVDDKTAGALSNVEIGRAPIVGSSRSITKGYVMVRMRQSGFRPEEFLIAGAEKVTVTRAMTVVTGAEIAAWAEGWARLWLGEPDHGAGPGYGVSAGYGPSSGAAANGGQAASPGPAPEQTPSAAQSTRRMPVYAVKALGTPPDVRLPSGGEVSFSASVPVTRDEWLKNPGTLQVTVKVASGTFSQEVAVSLGLTVKVPAVVTRTSIDQHAEITSEMVEVQYVDASEAKDAFWDLSQVLGMRALVHITPGRVLTPAMVRPRPLVFAGDLITLVSRVGGIEVTAPAKVLEDAGAGQRVKVQNLITGVVVYALVEGRDTASAIGPAPDNR